MTLGLGYVDVDDVSGRTKSVVAYLPKLTDIGRRKWRSRHINLSAHIGL